MEQSNILQMTSPSDTQKAIGQWIRMLRQRQEMTQPKLASKSGVPVSSLSRLERGGHGSIESLMRALGALSELASFHSHIEERLRQASLPRDISELPKPKWQRQRVRSRAKK